MNRWLRSVFAGIGAAVVLSACGSSEAPPSAPNAPASAAAAASAALPATSPAASPSVICGPADMVVRRMGIKNITAYTAVTDPNHLLGRQGEYTSKVEWSTDEEASGIEAFSNAADAQLRYAYLRAFRPPIGDGYDYLYRAAILRLASIYTPAQAAALHKGFEKACRESS